MSLYVSAKSAFQRLWGLVLSPFRWLRSKIEGFQMFGMQIGTSAGLRDITAMRSMRAVAYISTGATSGSRHVPNFSINKGMYMVIRSEVGRRLPQVSWNEGTKTLTWAPPPPYYPHVDTMDVVFMEYT